MEVVVALTVSVSMDIASERKQNRNSCLSKQDCIRAPIFAEQAIQNSHAWLRLHEPRLWRLQGVLGKVVKYLKSRDLYG